MGRSKGVAFPIGLDLSGTSAHAVQLESVDTAMRLTGLVSEPKPAADVSLRDQVDALLKKHRFVGCRVATVIPSRDLAIHHVQLPAMSSEAADEGIRAAIAQRLDYDVDQAVMRHLEVGSASGQSQGEHIVFTVPRTVVEEHLRMAERLGLELVGITALPIAVGHAFSYLGQRREEADFTFLVVHLGQRHTHLLIMHKGQLRFARTVGQGVHDVLDAVAKTSGQPLAALREAQEFQMRRHDDHVLLDSRQTEAPQAPRHAGAVPYAEAGQMFENYCEELLSCLCYYASAVSPSGVDKVVFAGPQANDYDFCQILAHRLGLPAQVGDPFAGIQLPRPADSDDAGPARPRPELAVSVGLSLFAATVN